jgi:uncharacterized protein
MKKSPVVHFEMPAVDKARVKKFYEEAFGWEMQQLGEEMSNYILAGTTEVGENGMPKNPGEINGGFYDKTEDSKEPSVVIAVDDLHKHIEIVKNAGGEIIGEPMDIPGIGNFVSFKDTEGNRVGMLQPAPMNS